MDSLKYLTGSLPRRVSTEGFVWQQVQRAVHLVHYYRQSRVDSLLVGQQQQFEGLSGHLRFYDYTVGLVSSAGIKEVASRDSL